MTLGPEKCKLEPHEMPTDAYHISKNKNDDVTSLVAVGEKDSHTKSE